MTFRPSYRFPVLGGRNGSRRLHHIAADINVEAVLLVCATQRMGKNPLSILNHKDLLADEDYIACSSAEWVDLALPPHGSGRRLFDGPLSSCNMRQTMGILSGLFG